LFEDKDLELISPYLKYQAMDFASDSTGSSLLLSNLSLTVGEQFLQAHPVNTLEAVANGTNIRIKAKNGQKIYIENLPVSGATIGGVSVNSVLNTALTNLNDIFTNTTGFSGGAASGNPVDTFELTGDDLTIVLEGGEEFTVDVTTLGVDENNFVSSGAVSGTDLVLTMSDSSTVTIDATNMVNGTTDSSLAPDISNQIIEVSEGDAFNAQIALNTGSDIVNMFSESDAPSWVVLNQSTGALLGTAPAYLGTTDDYVVNCKAANVLGGSVNFTVTLRVLEDTYTNTKSLNFVNNVNSFLGANAASNLAMARTGNGVGSSDAWTLSMWIKPSSDTSGQTLFYFGDNDIVNGGHIEIRKFTTSGNHRIRLMYGSGSNYIQKQTSNNISVMPANQWHHVLVSYSGGQTGASSGSVTSYYNQFKIFIDGVDAGVNNNNGNYGWTGSIDADNFRFGKYQSGSHPSDILFNQMAIWNNDQSGNVSGIYNGGSVQDLTDLSSVTGSMNIDYTPPVHYYEIETSTTSVPDIKNNAHLVGYNFSSSHLVTDAP
jgi:hypothetical protein